MQKDDRITSAGTTDDSDMQPIVTTSASIEANPLLVADVVDRTTPEIITVIKENEVFVFGSNLSGRHGKGAAKTALGWGANWGQAAGIQGKTYGIPTKDAAIRRTLTIKEIKPFVDDFIEWAKYHTGNVFYVTEIGCGLAGYKPKNIAPLFSECVKLKNVKLPQRFWHKLGGSNCHQRTGLCDVVEFEKLLLGANVQY
jgi:hypothetical protein